MFDTIKLKLTKFQIMDKREFRLDKGKIDLSDGKSIDGSLLFIDSYGKCVFGYKAYLNHKDIQVNVMYDNYNKVQCMYLTFSISKILNNCNYPVTYYHELPLVKSAIENKLIEKGIYVNLYDAEIRRIDVFLNIVLNRKYLYYEVILKLLKCMKMSNKEWGVKGSKTFQINNSRWQLAVYNKKDEFLNSNKDYDNNLLEFIKKNNILRLECRFIDAKKIREIMGSMSFTKFLDLKGYNRLRIFFIEKLYKAFTLDGNKKENYSFNEEYSAGNHIASFRRYALRNNLHGWFNSASKYFLFKTLSLQMSENEIIGLIEECFGNDVKERKAKHDFIKEFKSYKDSQLNIPSVKDLWNELENGILEEINRIIDIEDSCLLKKVHNDGFYISDAA